MPSAAPISIEISVHCEAWLTAFPDAEVLAASAARAALDRVALPHPAAPAILGIILTDDAEQRELNRT